MNIKQIKEYLMDNFDVNFDKKVVVDFYADWCVPCKMISPFLDEISKETKLQVLKVNVEEHNDIVNNISSVPTILVLTPTEHYDSFVGSTTKEVLKKFIQGVQ
jgi:thioredoxin 1